MNLTRRGILGLAEEYLRRDKTFRRINRGLTTPKCMPKDWYKGRGCRALGRHTKHGRYIIEKDRVPILVVPNLEGFPLKPYVPYSTPKAPNNIPQRLTLDEILEFNRMIASEDMPAQFIPPELEASTKENRQE